jgi:hypothetical protein
MEQVVEKVKCSVCGREFWNFPSYSDLSTVDEYMEKFGLCHGCAFFMWLKDNPHKYGHVIGGSYYDIYPSRIAEKKQPGTYLGGDGKKWRLLYSDERVEISYDVWLVGKIPEKFVLDFPQDAWLITPRAYQLLKVGKIICRNRVCYDRYRCYMYDIRQEIGNEPFNRVPSDWVAGTSGCPSFLNIVTEIKGYWDMNRILNYTDYEKEEIQSHKNGHGGEDAVRGRGKGNREKAGPVH